MAASIAQPPEQPQGFGGMAVDISTLNVDVESEICRAEFALTKEKMRFISNIRQAIRRIFLRRSAYSL